MEQPDGTFVASAGQRDASAPLSAPTDRLSWRLGPARPSDVLLVPQFSLSAIPSGMFRQVPTALMQRGPTP